MAKKKSAAAKKKTNVSKVTTIEWETNGTVMAVSKDRNNSIVIKMWDDAWVVTVEDLKDFMWALDELIDG